MLPKVIDALYIPIAAKTVTDNTKEKIIASFGLIKKNGIRGIKAPIKVDKPTTKE